MRGMTTLTQLSERNDQTLKLKAIYAWKALTKNNRLSFRMNLNAWSDIHRETHRNGIHCDTMTLCSRK